MRQKCLFLLLTGLVRLLGFKLEGHYIEHGGRHEYNSYTHSWGIEISLYVLLPEDEWLYG